MSRQYTSEENRAIAKFIQFLQIQTISQQGPSGAYQQAAKFLLEYAEQVGLSGKIIEFVQGKPIVIVSIYDCPYFGALMLTFLNLTR